MSTKTRTLGSKLAGLVLISLFSLLLLSSSPVGAVSPTVGMSSGSASAGSLVSFDSTGFFPGEIILVEFGGAVIAAAVADGDGSWSSNGIIPADMPSGSHPMDFYGDLGSWFGTDFTVLASVPSTTTTAVATTTIAPVATTTSAPAVTTTAPAPTTTSAPAVTTAASTPTSAPAVATTTVSESIVTIPLDGNSSQPISISRQATSNASTAGGFSIVLGIMSLCLLAASLATAASALSKR